MMRNAALALGTVVFLVGGLLLPASAQNVVAVPFRVDTSLAPISGGAVVGGSAGADQEEVVAFIDAVAERSADTFTAGWLNRAVKGDPRAGVLFTTQPDQAMMGELAVARFPLAVFWGAPLNRDQLRMAVGQLSQHLQGRDLQFAVVPRAGADGVGIVIKTAKTDDVAAVQAGVAAANRAAGQTGSASVAVVIEAGSWTPPGTTQAGAFDTRALRAACPSDVRRISEPANGQLRVGATVVRLCPGPLSGVVQAPRDALTTRVHELVTLVRQARRVVDPICPGRGGPTRSFVFGYPGGATQLASWELGGCRLVKVGDAYVDAGPKLLAAFDQLLLRQRQAQKPPRLASMVHRCGDPYGTPISQLEIRKQLRLAEGVVCVKARTGWKRTLLTGSQVRAINRDFAWKSVAQRPACRTAAAKVMLIGRTTWGDRLVLNGRCGQFVLPEPSHTPAATDSTLRVWRTSVRLLGARS